MPINVNKSYSHSMPLIINISFSQPGQILVPSKVSFSKMQWGYSFTTSYRYVVPFYPGSEYLIRFPGFRSYPFVRYAFKPYLFIGFFILLGLLSSVHMMCIMPLRLASFPDTLLLAFSNKIFHTPGIWLIPIRFSQSAHLTAMAYTHIRLYQLTALAIF